jgi:enoyl-[acyl-carrier protein] reductase I
MSAGSLTGRRILVTGIADEASLALAIARRMQDAGATLLCTGLGPTPHHAGLSPAAERYLAEVHASFCETVARTLGGGVRTAVLDAALDASIDGLAATLASDGTTLDGVVHAVAMDRTIRGGRAKPLCEVTREEFLDCMAISAWSVVALTAGLLRAGVLARGASVVALSYLGAERVMPHAYRNIGVAKAAMERIVVELAAELGPSHGVRVNAVRFSPWTGSRAGKAIPGLDEAVAASAARAPLGNAAPDALAAEVVHLLQPGLGITGEIRHVDGGYHVLG